MKNITRRTREEMVPVHPFQTRLPPYKEGPRR